MGRKVRRSLCCAARYAPTLIVFKYLVDIISTPIIRMVKKE